MLYGLKIVSLINPYNQIFDTDIFPSFLRSCSPILDRKELVNQCYQIQTSFPGVENSNTGGYHSPVLSIKDKTTFEKFDQLSGLVDITQIFVKDTLQNRDIISNISDLSFWINVNGTHSYNVMHSHGRADLIAIYYVALPENSGNFVVMRNDGSQYCNLYESRQDLLELTIHPKEGRLYLLPGYLWHYVQANQSSEDRISISFNVYLE